MVGSFLPASGTPAVSIHFGLLFGQEEGGREKVQCFHLPLIVHTHWVRKLAFCQLPSIPLCTICPGKGTYTHTMDGPVVPLGPV